MATPISTANNMGIGPLGNSVFKRKFRWTFQVANIGGPSSPIGISGAYVKVANRPQLEVEETEINFLNGKTWIPGKGTFQQLSVTYYDVANAGDSSINALMAWTNRVYNFMDGNDPTQITATQRTLAQPANGSGYAGTGILTLLDGAGFALEQWRLVNCWPVSINFGDLDYSSSEECTVEVNLRYSFAKYTNLCVPYSDTLPVPTCGAVQGAY